jgi:hypothetical protein
MQTDIIKSNIDRCLTLRRHRDKAFAKQVREVEHWKLQSLEACYASMMQAPAERDLLHYYFSDLFSGIDLTALKNSDKAAGLINKFFTGTDMLTSGLSFNALSQEMTEKITEALFETNQADVVDEESYVAACHTADVIPDLYQQLDIFADFAENLNDTISNRAVLAGVKIAKIPAKLGGFKNLHSLVADGIKYLSKVNDPEEIVRAFLAHEKSVVANIEAKRSPAFLPL